MIFLTFAGIDYWVTLTKHQYAEHLAHKYLERMSVEGRLSAADEASLIADFQNIGCPVESITAPRESRGDPRILRNPNDLNGSKVSLRVVCDPEPDPLFIGRVIGGQTGGNAFRIIVGGEMLSERVNP